MNINIDKLFEHIKKSVECATSTDEIEEIMDDAKKYLQICFSIKED